MSLPVLLLVTQHNKHVRGSPDPQCAAFMLDMAWSKAGEKDVPMTWKEMRLIYTEAKGVVGRNPKIHMKFVPPVNTANPRNKWELCRTPAEPWKTLCGLREDVTSGGALVDTNFQPADDKDHDAVVELLMDFALVTKRTELTMEQQQAIPADLAHYLNTIRSTKMQGLTSTRNMPS